MRKLDQRGTAALEFALVAAPLFILVFAIFDLGRYAITAQSLRVLAAAEARAMMIQCYTPALTTVPAASPSNCAGHDYLTASDKQKAAPFLFGVGTAPSVSIQVHGSQLAITASKADFSMLTPIWGSSLNGPSVSTLVPF